MIILDTNVLSEVMRPQPDEHVLAWLDAQDSADLWLTSVGAAEIYAGIAKLAYGAKRTTLAKQVEATLVHFHGRILPFDAEAAFVYGELAGPLLAKKIKYGIFDYQIAAIALVHGAQIATRNIKDFVDTGVPFINPWEA